MDDLGDRKSQDAARVSQLHRQQQAGAEQYFHVIQPGEDRGVLSVAALVQTWRDISSSDKK